MRLLVKGSPAVAESAARRHGIVAIFVQTLNNGQDTLLDCGDQCWRKVVEWFHETGSAPYPEGTLLFFNALNKDVFDPKLQGRP